MPIDAMMKLIFDGGDIQVFHADEHFEKPGRYVWHKGRYIIAGGECPSCLAKDLECRSLADELKIARETIAGQEAEIREGDYWMERAKESFSNGTCPTCFCTDEGPHEKGCAWSENSSIAEEWKKTCLLAQESVRQRDQINIELVAIAEKAGDLEGIRNVARTAWAGNGTLDQTVDRMCAAIVAYLDGK